MSTLVYEQFVNKLKTIYKDDVEWINQRTNLTSKQVKRNLSNFVKLLDDEEVFEMFLTKKLKSFSSKNENTDNLSKSLFSDDLTLKNILNNQPEQVKNLIWHDLHHIYLESMKNIEVSDKQKDNVLKLELLYKDKPLTTEDMVNDILASFNDAKSGNPFEKIMEISSKIQDKYGEKIENGEIDLDNLMSELTGNLGGLEGLLGNFGKKDTPKEKVIIDENFSTEKVQKGTLDDENKGIDMAKMMMMVNKITKLMDSSQNGENGEIDMSNLTDLLKELSPNGKTDPKLESYINVLNKLNTIDNPEEAEKLKSEMENLLKENQTPEMMQLIKSLDKDKEENKHQE
ncbi:hypothetical protein [Chlorella virus XW01]|nr:hypothetical protein [Chlorella virus XW01]